MIPPRKILQRFYRCDKKFHVDYLTELFQDDGKKFGLVWCESDMIIIYEFYSTYEMKKLKTISSHLKNAHKKGGQSQKRFERIVNEQRSGHYSNVGQIVSELHNSHHWEHLFIASSGSKKNEIQNELICALQSHSTVITISDITTPIQCIKTQCNINRHTATDQYIQKFYDSIHEGTVVYGKKETLEALQIGQLKVIFSTDETIRPLCESFGTDFVLLKNRSTLENRVIREFGQYGGLTRYKMDVDQDDVDHVDNDIRIYENDDNDTTIYEKVIM